MAALIIPEDCMEGQTKTLYAPISRIGTFYTGGPAAPSPDGDNLACACHADVKVASHCWLDTRNMQEYAGRLHCAAATYSVQQRRLFWRAQAAFCRPCQECGFYSLTNCSASFLLVGHNIDLPAALALCRTVSR